jgi:hypothetical protein
VARAGRRVHLYFEWLAKKDGNPAPFEESVHVEIVERIETYPWPKDPALPVHAFFDEDARPLRLWDLDMAERLLEWSRQDFLSLSGSLLPDSTVSMENDLSWKSLDELMSHLWETENAILKHFGVPVQIADLPSDAIGRLQMVRAKFLETLPQWSEADILVEEFGEKWSPRKALRRVLWHERNHIWELEKLIT